MKNVLGVVMILSALALAIAPAFTDCESQGKMLTTADGRSVSMKCHWAGIAEIAAAIPLGIAGLYTLRSRRKETTRFAGIVGGASAVMAIALPTVLIGTCMNPAMTCNLLMKPILLASAIVAVAVTVVLVVIARDSKLPGSPAVA